MEIAVRRSAVVDKRDLLLFDQLHILGLERRLGVLAAQDPAAAADLAYLAEEGIAMEVPETSAGLADLTRYLLRKDLAPILEAMDDCGEIDWPTNDGTRRDQLIQAELLASSGRHPAARFAGVPLPRGGEVLVAFAERLAGMSATPVLDQELSERDWRYLSSGLLVPKSVRSDAQTEQRIVDVVVRRLPMPSDECSLEAVLDFVKDPDVRRQARSLRLWMTRVADSDSDWRAMELELDTMLHEFEQRMMLHRLNAQTSFLRLAVTATLEAVEELLHLRPAKGLDALLQVRSRKARDLEAELAAPGHEVAFISSVRRRFASRSAGAP